VADDSPRAARKQQTIDRLKVGSFDADGLSEFSSAELSELLARTDLMRIPEIRLGLQQLIQVRQSQELADRLQEGMSTLDRAITESVAALEQTVTKSSAGAAQLNRTMVRLTWGVVALSLIMAVAAAIQISQWIEGRFRPVAEPPTASVARP
jgi:hypothetical protein